jgi:hypothetical protein
MRREQWQPKHTVNLVLVLAALLAVVVLAVWADGAYVREILAFVGGLLVPGSALGTLVGRHRSEDDVRPCQ